ncbi:GntR family transcriptional regulator [Rhizobium helianthi]|uniref:GntR family transcriptional regulator n=1 Tax=Rhizobium helianthi TaxID=1132695 RepID=A0ABW4M9J3_9HYPH
MSEDEIPILAERKRGSGVRIVYEALRNEILDLKLTPGSPIDEVQLASRFNMSRTPIREALVRLEGEGLIETLPNRSTIVSNIDFLNMHAYFEALVLMYRVTLRLAARNAGPEDMATIRVHQAAFADAVARQDALAMIETNADFHASIASAAGNAYYLTFFQRLLNEGRRLLRLYYQSFRDQLPQRFVDEHEEIICALERKDTEECDRLGQAHAEQIVTQIGRWLSNYDRDRITL